MKKALLFGKYYLKEKILRSFQKENLRTNRKPIYRGIPQLPKEQVSDWIQNKIASGEPFCVARYGGAELFAAGSFEFDYGMKKQKAMNQLCTCAGFFPNNLSYGDRFNDVFIKATPNVDVFASCLIRLEEYYLRSYGNKKSSVCDFDSIEPWMCPDNPWTKALKGKRVLVIHPFEQSIIEQYEKRDRLFMGTEILPEFDLKVLRAVQTIAGEKDDRFETWFDALDWMYCEALKTDFDVAIIGCGAYGLPLAARLKQAGKQAVHLGGITQILFGIRGSRWDNEEKYSYIRKYYNDAWVYPKTGETPKKAVAVEGGCYW